MSEKPYVSVEHISKWYPYKGDKLINHDKKFIKANDDINLSIQKGEILGVIGESGCGKSTLGKLLTRLETPTAGDCLINGVSTSELIKKDMKAFRRSVQIIFQNPFDTFTPRDTIEQILLRPLKNHNIGNSKEERRKLCIERLEEGGLVPGEDIMRRYPHELSGGQLQRISIIRAMLLDPEFIVADEPVSMLDVSVRAEIINMLLDLAKQHNTAVMFISHDIALTRYISDNIAVMYLGKVVEYGKADEVVNNPGHPYTKALISNCASIDPDEDREEISITGEPPTPLDPGPGCYFAPRCYMSCERCMKEYPEKKYLSDTHWITCMNAE